MGQRKSKQQKSSYDVAPVVSDRQFSYENNQNKKENEPNQTKTPVDSTKSEDTSGSALTAAQRDAEKKFDPKLIPNWLTKELFIDILKEKMEGFEKIVNFKAYPALSSGENYATLMLRVSIDAELNDKSIKNLSLMLKIAHDSEQMRKMLSIANYFIPENEMYSSVIPEIRQMYKDVGVDIEFAPRAYKFNKDIGQDFVLLEDLRPQGYINANRLKCLDMVHAKCVLRKLAQFHAAAATRVAVKGPYSKILMKGLFEGKKEAIATFDSMIGSFKESFFNNIKYFKDGDKYEPYVSKFLENMDQEFLKLSEYNEDDFNVLNHGDCWSNNILFKYNDSGEIIDLQFVDFQMSQFGSPAQDLYYFIFSSLQIDVKVKQFDFLIRYYYDNLIESLKLLQYPKKMPVLRELYIQLFKYSIWTLTTTLVTLPIVLLDPTDIASMDNFVGTNDEGMAFKNALFSNARYHEHINEILPWLHNRGLLEVMDNDSPREDSEECAQSTFTKVEEAPASLSPTAIEIPKWITESFFNNLLQKYFDDFKSIKSFKVIPGTSGGDNYASLMLQVDIDMELKNGGNKLISFMMKVAPSSKEGNALLNDLNTFDKEISMYEKYIPIFEEIYKKVGVNVTFGPKYFDLDEKPEKDIVLLKNLRPLGYKNENRLEGLDEEHTKATLYKLAQFHAASACYALENEYPVSYQKGIFSEEKREYFEMMMKVFLPILTECFSKIKGYDEYIKKMELTGKSIIDINIRAFSPENTHLNVLNHGDVWTNNILFKHDETGKIENTYFIDYQIVQYGSPAIDLYYFLLSSPKLELKLDKFDYFIKYYHDHLVENLKLLNYPKHIPSLKELHQELIERGAIGYGTVTGVMSAVLLDPTEQASMDNMLSKEEAGVEFRKQLYSNPRYQKHAEAILPWLNQRVRLDADAEDIQNKNGSLFGIPKWLNEEYFEKVLEVHFSEFSKILRLNTEIATKTGDNFASLVVKADIEAELKDGTVKPISFILKIPPAGEQAKFLMETWNSFKKESVTYNEYIPEFEALYKRVGRSIKFAPRYFRSPRDNDRETIILENLQTAHFKNANRLDGLNMDHTKCVLEKLAQFHAASVKRIEIGGSYPQYFNDGVYNEKSRGMFNQIMENTNKTILEAVKLYEGNEKYIGKMQYVVDTFLDKAIELNKVNRNDFNVLNHGDSWINNIMFSYNENGDVRETLFIDFQDCKYGSPAFDLYYFLFSSTQLDIKLDQFENFIRFYHEKLLENFNLLDYNGKVPKLEELFEDLSKYAFLGLSTILGVTTLCLLEPNENATIENIIGDTDTSQEVRSNMYTNPRYKAHAEKVLLWLNERGCFD